MVRTILSLLLILSLCVSQVQASVNVVRFPSGTPVKVCTPSDADTNCASGGGGGSGTVTSIATSNGLTGGTITTTGTISGVNAASDGATKGVAAFNATNFSCTTGVCNTIQDIASSSSPSFTNLSLSGFMNMSSQKFLYGTFSTTSTDANVFLGVGTGNATVGVNDNTGIGSGTLAGLTINSTGNTAVGNLALGAVTANYNTAIGYNAGSALTTGASNVLIGRNSAAGTSGATNVVVGVSATSTNVSNNVIIGQSAIANGFTGVVVLGQGATASADHQFMVGQPSVGSYINEVVLGQGDQFTTSHALTIRTSDANTGNNNTAGQNMTIQGSRSTGTGVGGSIILATSPAGSTGSAQNAAVTRLTIDGTGNVNLPGLTASQAVFSDGSKNLVSNAITGTGNVVMSASPTLTGSPLAPTQTVNDNSTKIATTAYVDNAVIGQNYKEAVKVATTATLVGTYSNGASGVGATFTYTATGVDAVDGVNLALGDRVLLKNQASDLQNGIYTVTTAGAIGVLGILTRATDANQSFEYKTGDLVFVTAGTTLTSTTWAYTGIDSPTMGTTSLTYVQVAGQGSFTGGNGITITGTSVAINTAVTADLTTAQTLSAKTLSYAVASSGGTYKGNILTLTSTETQAVGDVVQIDSSGQAHLAKADTLAHASGVLLAAAAVSGSASNTYLLPGGTLKLSSSPSWTVGGLVYLSSTGTTGNTLTQTAPSSTDNAIQILGVAVAADTILFMPSLSQITHT